MMFVGDIAIPNGIKFELNEEVKHIDDIVVANLEGLIVPDNVNYILDYKVYNSNNTIKYLKEMGIKVVTLANNHICDIPEAFKYTKKILYDNGIQFFGAGLTENEARKPVRICEGGVEYILVGFGWNVIGCKKIRNGQLGINQLNVDSFKYQITELVKHNKNARVVPFVHWDYELEFFPQPLHRLLAHWAIDNGAYAVIGSHPHCVQDIEIYKEHVIAYSLGNFMFPNNYYFKSKLAFPWFTDKEYGLVISKDRRTLVEFKHNKDNNIIEIIDQTELNKSTMEELNMQYRDYRKWFKEHRRKKKMLPIYDTTNRFTNIVKDCWVDTRHKMIYTMVHIGLKGAPK